MFEITGFSSPAAAPAHPPGAGSTAAAVVFVPTGGQDHGHNGQCAVPHQGHQHPQGAREIGARERAHRWVCHQHGTSGAGVS